MWTEIMIAYFAGFICSFAYLIRRKITNIAEEYPFHPNITNGIHEQTYLDTHTYDMLVGGIPSIIVMSIVWPGTIGIVVLGKTIILFDRLFQFLLSLLSIKLNVYLIKARKESFNRKRHKS